MTDLRLLRVLDDCDDAIHQIDEMLKDIRAGVPGAMHRVATLLPLLKARIPGIKQQLRDVEEENGL